MRCILFTILFFLFIGTAKSQSLVPGGLRLFNMNGVSVLVWVPWDYNISSGSTKYPLIWFMPGSGVSDSASLVSDGVGSIPVLLRQGTWNGTQYIPNGAYPNGDTAKFIIMMTAQQNGFGPSLESAIQYAFDNGWKIDTNYMALTGWSAGAAFDIQYKSEWSMSSDTYVRKFKKILPLAPGFPNIGSYDNFIGTKTKVYYGTLDGVTGVTPATTIYNGINLAAPGAATLISLAGDDHDINDTVYRRTGTSANTNNFIWMISDTAGNNGGGGPSLTLVGYIKNNTGQFGVDAGCTMTNIVTAVYSSTRTIFGQVGVGDVLRDAGGTPINGGSQAWGYTTINGGSAERSIKLTSAGVVQDMIACSRDANWYRSASGVTSCGATGLTTAVYDDITDHDPGLYLGKVLFNTSGGQRLADGTYVVARTSGGSAVYSITVSSPSGSSGVITAITACQTDPIMNAGSDATYSLPSPSITLNASGSFDPDGYIASYAWNQVSGPNTAGITSPNSVSTTITGVIAGTYVFRITGTDDASNTGTDDVTITVNPIPLVANPRVITINLDQVMGLEGEDYRGVYGSSWNLFDRGTQDPRNGSSTAGKYDYDSVTTGWQNKPTSGRVQRLTHDWFRGGLGRQIWVEWDTVQYFTHFYIYDTTSVAGHTVKIYVGDKAKMQKARWPNEFGSTSPTYTYTTTSSRQWTPITLSGQDSGQYMIVEVNNFAVDFTLIAYGGTSPYGTMDTSIVRKRTLAATTDTLVTSYQIHGINNENQFPYNSAAFVRDSLLYYGGGVRTYLAPIKTGPTTIVGESDPDVVAFDPITGSYSSTNRIDLNPFISGLGSDNPYVLDSLLRAYGFPVIQNDRGTNGLYASQSGYQPEYIPKNTAASNPRSREAWTRKAYEIEAKVAKFYQNTSPPNSFKYRYLDDRWPGQFGLNFFSPELELGNEMDEGFRAFPPDSCYMTPEMMMFHHSVIYDSVKPVQASLTIMTQAFVAGNISPLKAMIKNAYLYYGNRRVFFDAVSWHTQITEKVFDHTPTNDELLGQHGAFPGRHKERLRMKNIMLDVARELGRHVTWYNTEYGYTKDSIGPTIGSPTYADQGYSHTGSPQVKNHTKEENHAIMYANAFWDYCGIAGMKRVNWYTNKDNGNVDSIPANGSCPTLQCYFNADASNGIMNFINSPRILFPAFWYIQGFVKRFGNWRFKEEIQYDSMGYTIDKWEHVNNSDSIMYLVRYQNRTDAPNTTNINVGSAASCTRYQLSFTSFDGTSSSQSINSGFITVTGRPEGDMYVTYQPSGSNPTGSGTYILRKKKRMKRG